MASRTARRASDEVRYLASVARSGLLAPALPHQLAQMGVAIARSGPLGALPRIAAIRYGERTALIDERGSITFSDLDLRSNAIANAWIARGLRRGEGVAILARNHRGFLEAAFAAAKCGARIILLNTDFAGPQLREVAAREGTDLLVYDDEYAGMLEGVAPKRGRFRAWSDDPGPDTLDALASGSTSPPTRFGAGAKIILLTSGTTGTPKGANRKEPRSLQPLGGLLERVPFRTREVVECAAPMFHALGFASAMLALGMGSTLVVRRRFDAAAVLDSLHDNGVTTLVAVPVMLQRLVDLGSEYWQAKDMSQLRIIFLSGSQLGADLCERAMAALGPIIYNLYGSTEVAYATLATPEDLAAEPGCVGKPIRGTVVRLYDDNGTPVPEGGIGRIFVGNPAQFDRYTGGGGVKQIIDGLMSSGDIGHFDKDGRLFIDGRDDDMIVSGGENVFPREVEDLLAAHASVVEASVIGTPDDKHGQRLIAFVVPRQGVRLSEDDVRTYVTSHLARFKTPRDVHFLDELPRNPAGKVLKRELRELAKRR